MRLGEGIVFHLACGLDVYGWGTWGGCDGNVAFDYVDGDFEDAWRKFCRALNVREVGLGAAVDEIVDIVASVSDGSDKDHSAVVVECEDG